MADRARTGSARLTTSDAHRLHHGHHESGDDRTRTGGLSPDKRVLCTSELRPRAAPSARPSGGTTRDSAGGIRTHGLELMRLARTASPLPRKSGWQESNLRSPAPEAGGVAKLPYSQMNDRSAPPAGLEPAASGLRARRHRRFDHGGIPLRRQDSNLPLAINSRASCRLDHAGTKAEAAGLEPANGSHRLRGSNALPCQLGHASARRKERESNPQSP